MQALETVHSYVNNVLQTSNHTLNMDGTYTYDTGGEGKIKSVNYPTTYSNNGGNLAPKTGPTYTYSFDAMYRPTGLTDQNNNTLVNNVTYNPADQLLTFNTETRAYNNLNQMGTLKIIGLNLTFNIEDTLTGPDGAQCSFSFQLHLTPKNNVWGWTYSY